MSENKNVCFKGETKDDFLVDVRQNVDDYFHVKKIKKTANWQIYLKTIILSVCCILLYCTLLNGWLPIIPRLIIWIAFGINQALIAVNIGHDALHGSYFNNRMANKILGYLTYDFLGLSSFVWKQTHNREHHTFTNIAGSDPDIDKPGILRLSPHDPHFKIHKLQHLYVWILYSLVSLNWVLYSDYTHIWKYRDRLPKAELLPFFGFKALNLFIIVIAPLLWSPMPWWEVLVGFFLLHCSAGLTVSIIFQLAHLVENVEFPLPNENGVINTTWSAHEMATTSNFATDSALVTHFVGGLNFQIEHHLLPKISHCHYPMISKIVRQTAKNHHLPYYEQPTLGAAIASHTRFLKKLGAASL